MITFNGTDMLLKPPRYPSEEVKLELGGRWDKATESWKLAPTSLNVLKLIEWYGEEVLEGVPSEIADLAKEPWGFRGFFTDELAEAQAHPSWSKLYPFQREGVEYMVCNPHGAALCALSWGMGKSAVTSVAADLIEAKRILILAPLTLAPAWKGELERWCSEPRDIKRAQAGDREPGPEVTIANHEVIQETVVRDENGVVHSEYFEDEIKGGIYLSNAKAVKQWIEIGPTKENEKGKVVPVRERIVRVRRDYLEMEWDLIVVDESVLLKNRKAVKGDVLGQLRKKHNPMMFLLSGSPTTKFRNDLYPQMKVLYPKAFGAYWRFTEFFCVVDKGGWGWTIEGDRPDHDPHHYLRDLMWVKSQDEALPELPEYIEQHIELEPTATQEKALDQMLNDWIVELDEVPGEKVTAENWLARNTRLQQITSNMGSLPKPSGKGFYPHSSAKEDLLYDLVSGGDIELPLLVWTWYVETTDSITKRLGKIPGLRVTSVTGRDSSDEKDARIQAYKDGEIDVLVMQTATGKFGHTFTDTRTVFYHDRSFDSDAYVQSLARVRRIGLKHEPALIVPKIKGSADELVQLNLEGKLGAIARMTNADLARLLRSLRA